MGVLKFFPFPFVGTTNLLATRVHARHGDALKLGFRPHALHIERADTAAAPQGIVLTGTVEASAFLGKYYPHQAGGAAFAVGA